MWLEFEFLEPLPFVESVASSSYRASYCSLRLFRVCVSDDGEDGRLLLLLLLLLPSPRGPISASVSDVRLETGPDEDDDGSCETAAIALAAAL